MTKLACLPVRRKVSALLDGALPTHELSEAHEHVASCQECRQYYDQAVAVRQAIRSLPKLEVPPALTTSLRVLGSQERVRSRQRESIGALAAHIGGDIRLWFNNLMRPLALPFAGGLMTATLVFSMFVTTYPGTGQALDYDVPIWPRERNVSTEAYLKTMTPLEFTGAEVTVDLVIDEQGRVVDYDYAGGQQSYTPAVRRTIENILLFSEFIPATASGHKVSGKVRVSFRRSAIEVRG